MPPSELSKKIFLSAGFAEKTLRAAEKIWG